MKVNIKLELQYENETIKEEVSGILKEKELVFRTNDKNRMHFYFMEHLFIRDTEESIFSYHFLKNGSLEIYLKEFQKATRIPLITKKYRQEESFLEVVYEIEGNDACHSLKLEWR